MVLANGKIINLMKSKIFSIAGDASFRTFYRLILNNKSRIIVLAKKEKYKNLIVYSTINKFLRSNKDKKKYLKQSIIQLEELFKKLESV